MKKIFSIFIISAVLSILFIQVPVFADGPTITGSTPPPTSVTGQTPSSNCTQGTICNPLGNVDTIQGVVSVVLKFVVNLLAIAGVLYILWSGLLFVRAQGNPKELEIAKKSFLNALIGMAIILGAWAIATVIANTINKVTGNNSVILAPQN